MKGFLEFLALAFVLWATLVLVSKLCPGPGEADIRGPAKTVTW